VKTLISLFPMIYMALLLPCRATEQDSRFVEVKIGEHSTATYNLSTVQIIQPGRFTIFATTIDNPEVMKFRLKVLDTLQTYCSWPVGKYPAPNDLLALGPADMPIKNIEVENGKPDQNGQSRKMATWAYPYRKLAWNNTAGPEEMLSYMSCGGPSLTRMRCRICQNSPVNNTRLL